MYRVRNPLVNVILNWVVARVEAREPKANPTRQPLGGCHSANASPAVCTTALSR